MEQASDLEINIMHDIVDKCNSIIKTARANIDSTTSNKKLVSSTSMINSKKLTKLNKLDFLINICSEIKEDLKDGDIDAVVEAARMIDFLQGAMWMAGLISVSKLKELNSESAIEISSSYNGENKKIDYKNLN